MRESYLNPFSAIHQAGNSKSTANSLFQKILPASPYSSIFCPESPIPRSRKPFALRILQRTTKKMLTAYPRSEGPNLHRLQSRSMFYRSDNRSPDQLRPVVLTPDFITTAEGSVLIEVGNTRVICTASIEETVPSFMRNSGKGWISSEYSMLPRATLTRSPREVSKGRQSGRTHEIQRLIG